MANKPKQMGTEHESKIKAWLREHGWPYADRRTQNGAADLGDLVLSERIPFIIEAKTAKKTTERATLGTFVSELKAEVGNSKSDAGAVVFKKVGTTDVGEYYAIMPVNYLNHLLKLAYGEKAEPITVKRVVGRRVVTQTIPPTG